jgi:hypothetical protein
MARTARKPLNDTNDVEPKARKPFDLSSLANGGGDIEIVSAGNKQNDLYTDPAFLNEELEIMFMDNGDPNAPKLVELLVNTIGADGKTGGKSTRLAFARNVRYVIPRYVFEVIAHAKITSLQPVQNRNDPMNITYVERHSFYYPVQVLSDPNPKGAAWRELVLSQPA